ncbi:MAG: ubiquinone/menaquinone biosynthesis methyltransferase [Acidimicrobiia bacterium]
MNTNRVLRRDGSLPTGGEKREAVEAMFDRVAPTYDRANRVISLGMDSGWRRRAVRTLQLPVGSRVLDIACGTGDFCCDLQAAGLRPMGIDFSAGMLQNARTSAPLLRGDALALPVRPGALDGITCGFALRNFVDLDAHFAAAADALRPGGRYIALDATEPANALVRIGHRAWFGTMVPLLGKVVSRDGEAYRYLPKSTAYLPPRAELEARLRAAGFGDVRSESLLMGSAVLLSGTRA